MVVCGGSVVVGLGEVLEDDGGSDVMVTIPDTTGTAMRDASPLMVIVVAIVPSLTVSVQTAEPLAMPHWMLTENVMPSSVTSATSDTCDASSTSVTNMYC